MGKLQNGENNISPTGLLRRWNVKIQSFGSCGSPNKCELGLLWAHDRESTRLQLSDAPGTLSPEILLAKSIQIGFNTDTFSWTVSQPKDTEQRAAVIVSISHNRAVFTRDAGFRINLLGGGLSYIEWGVLPGRISIAFPRETKLKGFANTH